MSLVINNQLLKKYRYLQFVQIIFVVFNVSPFFKYPNCPVRISLILKLRAQLGH